LGDIDELSVGFETASKLRLIQQRNCWILLDFQKKQVGKYK